MCCTPASRPRCCCSWACRQHMGSGRLESRCHRWNQIDACQRNALLLAVLWVCACCGKLGSFYHVSQVYLGQQHNSAALPCIGCCYRVVPTHTPNTEQWTPGPFGSLMCVLLLQVARTTTNEVKFRTVWV
jgi:hypothetical protein